VSQRKLPGKKYLVWMFGVVALVFAAVLAAFGLAVFTAPPQIFIECDRRAHISVPLWPGQVVFTGKILTTLGPCVTFQGRTSCNGAVALVQERFFGTRSKLLLLSQGYFENQQEYLFDGDNFGTLPFSRFLPIVGFTGRCSHSARLEDADVDLRILRDKSTQPGVRIIGKVLRRNGRQKEPLAGAKVFITGPQGTVTATTDGQGVYDISSLPPGHYEVHSELRGQDPWYTQCWNGQDLKSGSVGGRSMLLD
jgi:carboxypeptidase family protein